MELRIAKTMVTKAFDNDKIGGHALKAFRATKPKLKFGQNARQRTLTFPEYIQILDQAPSHLQGIVTTAMSTGMRMGEILNLKWSHINDGFINLPFEQTKEKKSKIIPINHHIQAILDNIVRAIHHNYIFTYRGNAFAEGGIKRSFMTACINAQVPYGRKTDNGLTFHDIRRTVKTNMVRAGVDKVYRDLILGHSLKGMDAYYIAPDKNTLKRAMGKYTDWFDQQIELALQNVDQSVDQTANT